MNTHAITGIRRQLLVAGASLAGIAGLSSQVHAELLAYEGFDYNPAGVFGPTDLIGGQLQGGEGWNGAWVGTHASTQSGQSPVLEGSLTYTDAQGNSLQTSGNRAEVRGQTVEEGRNNTTIGRGLPTALDTTPGNVYYISFIGQRTGEPADADNPEIFPDGYPENWGDNLYPRAAGVRLLSNFPANDQRGLIGRTSNRNSNVWTFLSQGTSIETDTPFTEQSFVVVRLEYVAVGEGVGTTVSMWVNPSDLSQENLDEAYTDDVLDGENPYAIPVTGIGLEGGNEDQDFKRPASSIMIDEIRVGTTWAAVTPHEAGEPPVGGEPFLGDYEVDEDGWADTGNWLGLVWVEHAPWVWSENAGWIYIAESSYDSESGAWVYIAK